METSYNIQLRCLKTIIFNIYLQLYDIYNIEENIQSFIDFLESSREDAILDSAGRPIHCLAPNSSLVQESKGHCFKQSVVSLCSQGIN